MAHAPIDLSSILAQPTYVAQNPVAQGPLVAAAPKAKKKTATADEKREKIILSILNNKDVFGLEYCKLLLQMSPEEIEQLVLHVRAKNNMG